MDEFLFATTAQNRRKVAKLTPDAGTTAARLNEINLFPRVQTDTTLPTNAHFFNDIAGKADEVRSARYIPIYVAA